MSTFIKILGVLIGILLIGFLILTFALDGIVKSNIEDTGSNLLKSEVDVDDVSISVFDSRGTIDGIAVENPERFGDHDAIKLQEIIIDLDLSSLLSDTLVIDTLIIQQPEIYLEQTTEGNNLMILQQNLAASSSGGSGSLVIDYVLIEDGIIHVSTNIGGEERSAQVELDRFVLHGIGRKGSSTVRQGVQQILEPVLEQAIRKAATGTLRNEVEERLRNLLDG